MARNGAVCDRKSERETRLAGWASGLDHSGPRRASSSWRDVARGLRPVIPFVPYHFCAREHADPVYTARQAL